MRPLSADLFRTRLADRRRRTPDLSLIDRRAMLTSYDGGKNQPGVWQRIISLMPPHDVYVEPFLGSGAILRRKLPARVLNVGIDADPEVIARYDWARARRFTIVNADAITWLDRHSLDQRALIYADPPYLMATRSSQRPLYRCEFATENQHARLLDLLTSTDARVIISGYDSPLYNARLAGWERRSWSVTKRNGRRATEVVWFNFEPPTELHDYRFIGRDFHDRTRIWRKIRRWQTKLNGLPAIERNAIISGILKPETALRTRELTTSTNAAAGAASDR